MPSTRSPTRGRAARCKKSPQVTRGRRGEVPADDRGAEVRLSDLHRRPAHSPSVGRRGGALGTTTAPITTSASRQLSTLRRRGGDLARLAQAARTAGRRTICRPPTTSRTPKSQHPDHRRGGRAGAERSSPRTAARRATTSSSARLAAGAIAGVTTVLERVLERVRPGDGRGAVPVPVDGRLRRPDGDLLGRLRQGARTCRSVSIRPSRGPLPLLPGARLHRLRTERRHQPVRAGHGVPHVQGLQRLQGAGRLRLRADRPAAAAIAAPR